MNVNNKKGIGSRFLQEDYNPQEETAKEKFKPLATYQNINKVPINFTEDIIEYAESKEFLGMTLRPLQRRFLEDFYSLDSATTKPKYDQGVFIAGMRSGKSLACLTNVMMFDGTIKKAEDVKVGDQLMGPDSKPRLVLRTDRGESEMYEIQQSAAMTYTVNEHHIISVKKASSTTCGEGIRGASGKKIYARYPNEPDIVNIHIKDYLEKSKKWKYFFRGYKAGVINFKEQEVPLDPYFLGVWLGDGSKDSQTVHTPDIEIRDYLKKYASYLNMDYHEYKKKDENCYDCRIKRRKGSVDSNYILDILRELNLINNKNIPQSYISNIKEVRLELLAGILDTDGYYTKKHGYEIILADQNLAEQVKLIADTLGYRTNITEKVTTNQYIGFEVKAWRVNIYGNVWEIPVKIERKKYVYNGKSSNKEDYLSSLKVKSVGWGEYAGIEVDGDNLFCLADGTVTHNSVMASIIGTFQTQRLLAMDDPATELRQMIGQRLTCQCIASSEAQAKETAYAAIESIIDYNPYWQKYIEYLQDREANGEGKGILYEKFQSRIEFKEKNLAILSLHSNSASLAGKTSYCCIFDELSRFNVSEGAIQSKTQRTTADAVYNTVSRAAKSLKPFSKIITITSPMYEDDYGMKLLLMAKDIHVGSQKKLIDNLRSKVNDKVTRLYGMHATTMEVNPDLTEEDFEDEKIANPEAYRRDYLAIPPAALSPFFEYPERIEKCVRLKEEPKVLFEDTIIEESLDTDKGWEQRFYIGKKVLPIEQDIYNRYYICCDQGERKDNFVLAMGHLEEIDNPDKTSNKLKDRLHYKIVIDIVEGWVPDKENRITVSFQNVEEVIKKLASIYNVSQVTFDKWNSVESIQRLFSSGINTKELGATLEMYEEFKNLVYQGYVEMPNHDILLKEMRQLNKFRQKVDHPSGGSKDYSDAVCRVVYSIYEDYIREAIEGDFMGPKEGRIPTMRSLAQAVEFVNQSEAQKVATVQDPHTAIWQTPSAGSATDKVFGSGTIVRSNVMPEFKKKR